MEMARAVKTTMDLTMSLSLVDSPTEGSFTSVAAYTNKLPPPASAA